MTAAADILVTPEGIPGRGDIVCFAVFNPEKHQLLYLGPMAPCHQLQTLRAHEFPHQISEIRIEFHSNSRHDARTRTSRNSWLSSNLFAH